MLCLLRVVAFLFTAEALAFCGEKLEPEHEIPFANGVVRLEIRLSEAARTELEKAPRRYVRADVRIGAENYSNGGIHLKGYGSFQALSQKPSFTIKLDQFVPQQSWHGLRKLHLNNAGQDPSYLSEYLGFEMFHASGLPAPRTGFATVRLTSEAWNSSRSVESTPHLGPPHEPGDQTNRLTPHPSPLPFEGRGRPDAAAYESNARIVSGNSLPAEGRGKEIGLYVLVEGVTKDFLALNFHTRKGTVSWPSAARRKHAASMRRSSNFASASLSTSCASAGNSTPCRKSKPGRSS